MKKKSYLIISVILLFTAGCLDSETSETIKITDSLKLVIAKYAIQLEQKGHQLNSIQANSGKVANLQDSLYILVEKLKKINVNHKNPTKSENRRLEYNSNNNELIIDNALQELKKEKKRVEELNLEIEQLQGTISQLESKAKEDDQEKIELESKIKKIQSDLSSLSAIKISSINVQYYRTGIGKSAKKIKMVDFCFLVESHPIATDGVKTVHACISNPEGKPVNPNEGNFFTTPEGEKKWYTFASEIDFQKDLTIEDKCITWNDVSLVSGTYKLSFYIETRFSGESEFVVP